jgi:hypothetical protein
MIQWRISEYVDADNYGTVSRWFDSKSRKNKAFRKIQNNFQAKLDMIVSAGPEISAVTGSDVSPHIDKIHVSGRLTIRVLFMRGPGEHEVKLLGASKEENKLLVEPGIYYDVPARRDALMNGTGKRREYVYYSP